MRPYMCKGYQSSFNIEKYFIFLKTTHVVVGTESWLSPEISSSEIFPLGYTPCRNDRKTGRGGGVFVLVRNDYICSEQPQFQTD